MKPTTQIIRCLYQFEQIHIHCSFFNKSKKHGNRLQLTNRGGHTCHSLTYFIRLSPVITRLEGCDWSIKLNIKLEFIYPVRLINLLVRMDGIMLLLVFLYI